MILLLHISAIGIFNKLEFLQWSYEFLSNPSFKIFAGIFITPSLFLLLALWFKSSMEIELGFFSDIPLFWASFDLSGWMMKGSTNLIFDDKIMVNLDYILPPLFIASTIIWLGILKIEKSARMNNWSYSLKKVDAKTLGRIVLYLSAWLPALFTTSAHIFLIFFGEEMIKL